MKQIEIKLINLKMNDNTWSEYQPGSSSKRLKTNTHKSYISMDKSKKFKNANIIDSFMYNFNKFKELKGSKNGS